VARIDRRQEEIGQEKDKAKERQQEYLSADEMKTNLGGAPHSGLSGKWLKALLGYSKAIRCILQLTLHELKLMSNILSKTYKEIMEGSQKPKKAGKQKLKLLILAFGHG